MSPPSWATAGRTRVSSSSLIWRDDLVFLAGGFAPRRSADDHRAAGGEMLHDHAEHGGLQHLPVLVAVLGDGDEIGAEEHAGDALDAEQALGQRRTPRAPRGRGNPPCPHAITARPGRNFRVGGIRGLFGLDEHGGVSGPCTRTKSESVGQDGLNMVRRGPVRQPFGYHGNYSITIINPEFPAGYRVIGN